MEIFGALSGYCLERSESCQMTYLMKWSYRSAKCQESPVRIGPENFGLENGILVSPNLKWSDETALLLVMVGMPSWASATTEVLCWAVETTLAAAGEPDLALDKL